MVPHIVFTVKSAFITIPLVLSASAALSSDCYKPIPPLPTTEAIAKEFRAEFRAEFEVYFSEVQTYLRCVEEEHSFVLAEIEDTSRRYARFLNDSAQWQKYE